jgi:hypothetical protein
MAEFNSPKYLSHKRLQWSLCVIDNWIIWYICGWYIAGDFLYPDKSFFLFIDLVMAEFYGTKYLSQKRLQFSMLCVIDNWIKSYVSGWYIGGFFISRCKFPLYVFNTFRDIERNSFPSETNAGLNTSMSAFNPTSSSSWDHRKIGKCVCHRNTCTDWDIRMCSIGRRDVVIRCRMTDEGKNLQRRETNAICWLASYAVPLCQEHF